MDIESLFSEILTDTTDEVYCNLPCQVENVNGNFVDVKVFINDEIPDQILYNVPIQRPETQRAYIFLGISKGDRGTLKFFDRSTEGYLKNDYDYNSDDRQHDINDRCFELGFMPDGEAFVYPNGVDIEIGTKDSTAKISFANGGITIIATNINTQGNLIHTGDLTVNGVITATGEITSGSIPLSTHKHLGVTTGANTSGLPTV